MGVYTVRKRESRKASSLAAFGTVFVAEKRDFYKNPEGCDKKLETRLPMSPPPPLMPSPGDLISLLASGGWDSFGPAVILAAHFSSLPSATTGGDDDDTAAWSSATMAGVGAAVVAAVHILWFWIGVTMTTKTTLTRTISYWAAGSSASLDLLLLLALSQPLPPPSEVHLHSQAAKAGGWSGCGAWLLPSHAPEVSLCYTQTHKICY